MNYRSLFCVLGLLIASEPSWSAPLYVDAVVASVNGDPITLSDVQHQSHSATPLTLAALSHDPELRLAVDQLVLRKLIREEARRRGIAASATEIDRYLDEIARTNSLSRDEFLNEVERQGISLNEYRIQVELDILRTKLAQNLFRGGISVSDEEVERYLSEHGTAPATNTKVTLRQVFIPKEEMSTTEARALAERIQEETHSSDQFIEFVNKYSEGRAASEGGLLGTLVEKDLSPEIFDAVFSLQEGKVGPMVTSRTGYHIFFLEKRFSEGDQETQQEELRASVRKKLESERLQQHVQDYFSRELYKNHTVEKKYTS